MNIGKSIEILRKAKGWNQQHLTDELAKLTGLKLKRGTISNYENGKSKPSALTIPLIAKVLGVSIDELFNACEVNPEVKVEVKPEQTLMGVNENTDSYSLQSENQRLRREVDRLNTLIEAYLQAFKALGAGSETSVTAKGKKQKDFP